MDIGRIGLIVFLGLYAVQAITTVAVHPLLLGGAAAVAAIGLALGK